MTEEAKSILSLVLSHSVNYIYNKVEVASLCNEIWFVDVVIHPCLYVYTYKPYKDGLLIPLWRQCASISVLSIECVLNQNTKAELTFGLVYTNLFLFDSQKIKFTYVNHPWFCCWNPSNQPVLSNEGNISCSTYHREPFMGFEQASTRHPPITNQTH